jgi:hypothetical protein
MSILGTTVGAWSGTNGFRLMPGDEFAELPDSANVVIAGGGHLTFLAYSFDEANRLSPPSTPCWFTCWAMTTHGFGPLPPAR